MPKEITHWLIAEECADSLADHSFWRSVLGEYPCLYLLGTVVPDSPAYVLFGNNAKLLRNIGNDLHRLADPYILFRHYFKKGNSLTNAELALFAGILSHFMTDSAFHPFVTNRYGNDIEKHYRLETLLDLYFAPINIPLGQWSMKRFLKQAQTETNNLLTRLTAIFSWEITVERKAIETMLYWHCALQGAFTNPAVILFLYLFGWLPFTRLREGRALCYPRNRQPSKKILSAGEFSKTAVEALKNNAVKTFLEIVSPMQHPDDFRQFIQTNTGPNLLTGKYIERVNSAN